MRPRRARGFAGLLLAAAAWPALAAPEPTIETKAETAAAPSAVGYQPQDADERGLWMQMDEAERELRASNFVVRDAALNAYVKGVLCRTVGEERCGTARVYIVRTPYFNANMAPNGMMQVWTGLLLRTRDEAQLAAVLGHEFSHFEHKHSLRLFRDIRAKTDAMAWLSFVPYGVGLLAQVGLMGSIFQFNRDMERDADISSLGLLAQAGYRPGAASAIWAQMRVEMDATATERKRRSRKDQNGGFFASHPNSAERMQYLTEHAAAIPHVGQATGEAEYRAAMKDWWAPLIDDQIKLNDFGATEFLLESLAGGTWTSELLFARGELYRARGKDGDFAKAAEYYRQSIAQGTPLPEARRGLGLALLRMGAPEEGRQLLKEYVKLRPDATDRSMMVMLAGGE